MTDIKTMLIPYPQSVSEVRGLTFLGSFSCPVGISYDDIGGVVFDFAVKTITKKLKETAVVDAKINQLQGYNIYIKIDPDSEALKNIHKAEAYCIEIKEDKTSVYAADEAGVYYAILTLCNLIVAKNDRLYLPVVDITDYPDFSDRAQFIECRYGSDFMQKKDWFAMIDYFSKMKFNCVVVGLYGCWPVQYDGVLQEYLYIPFKKYPELKTPRDIKYYSARDEKFVVEKDRLPLIFEEDFFGELIKFGMERNVRVEPMFNSLGHNSLIPRVFPHLSAKDERGADTGFGMCTESDETYKFMCDLYDEIIDRYLVPNDIHSIALGFDEILDSMGIDKNDLKKNFSYLCKCDKCRSIDEKELILRFVIKLCKYLKSRGITSIYLYQDMFLYEYDIINEELKQRFIDEDIYDVVVIDWWSYDVEDNLFLGKTDKLNNLFRSTMKPMTGYFHWSFPTEMIQNLKECISLAVKLGYEGVRAYTGFDYCYDKNFLYQSDVSWNTKMLDEDDFDTRYAYRFNSGNYGKVMEAIKSMSEIMSNDKKDNYIYSAFDYYMYSYLRADKSYPRSYPSEAYTRAFDDEKNMLTYLRRVYEKSKFAFDIFDTECAKDKLTKIWLLTAKQYYVSADEFLTMMNMNKLYETGAYDEYDLLNELNRLIWQREDLMYDAETIRIKGNSYQYLRNMTIIRQYMIDIRDYIKNAISNGKKVMFDLKNLDYVKSEFYDFFK